MSTQRKFARAQSKAIRASQRKGIMEGRREVKKRFVDWRGTVYGRLWSGQIIRLVITLSPFLPFTLSPWL